MSRKIYIIGNWKMHNTISEAIKLSAEIASAFEQIAQETTQAHAPIEIVVAPPFTALAAVSQTVSSTAISLASQNISFAPSGAHTGEISAAMLQEVGATYAIIGHSERRHIYKEDDRLIQQKVQHTVREGIIPIVCVGELLEERKNNQHFAVCTQQIQSALDSVTADLATRVIIAYEPVWAIGTGETATPQDAQEMHVVIRKAVQHKYGADVASGMSILYGGSVKPDNSKALLAEKDIDGALIGGASLKVDSFINIIQSAQ